MTKYRLIYFDIRGLAEPIRWMFAIVGKSFVDERIPLDQWSQEKLRFNQHVGQLPILYVDELALTQVHSCMRYVARRLGFNGSTEQQAAKADEACELIYDLRLCCVAFKDSFVSETPDIIRHTVFRDFYKETRIVKKVQMRRRLVEDYFPRYFKKFAELLEEAGGNWIAGPQVTYADLCLANFLDVIETLVNPDVLNDFPTLRQLKKDVFNIPQIQKFMESSINKTNMIGG